MPRSRQPIEHAECEECGNCTCEHDSSCSLAPTPSPEQVMRPTNKEGIPRRRRACGNCGRLGHLTRTCRAPAKGHDKLGIEVEGWWRDLSATRRVAENWHMDGTHDGSLAYDRSGETEAYEFRTRPGSLGEAISQVVAIYPDKCDKSAGMHVHMSFIDCMDISLLASPAFVTYMRERWAAWGRRMNVHAESDFWTRLNGDNDYCEPNDPARHLRTTELQSGSRYRQLNFTSFARHGTMELRMLPLFRDAKLAVLALEEWVAIVEDFLQLHADAYLASFDRSTPLAATAAPRVREEAYEIPLATPVIRTDEHEISLDSYARTIERAFNADGYAREVSHTVTVPDYGTVTPGHTRMFGGEAAILNQVRRLVRQGV